MSNECICANCGTLTRLDDVRYSNDSPLCEKCQKDLDIDLLERRCDWEKYKEQEWE